MLNILKATILSSSTLPHSKCADILVQRANFYGAHLLMIQISRVAFFMILVDWNQVSYQSWAVFYIYIYEWNKIPDDIDAS
jgi:hypothetical protein